MSKSKIYTGLAGGIVFAALIGASSSASATPASACDLVVGNLIQNCGFETGTFSSWNKLSSTGISGLTITSPGYTGNDMATFAGDTIGSTPPRVDQFNQTINNLTPGHLYELSFEFESIGNGSNGGFVGFNIPGGFNTLATFTDIPATTWTLADYSFVITTPGITLQIGGNDPEGSWSVDDFVLKDITPVPEPVTLSLFGAGVAGAVALRRKKKSKSA